MRNKILLVGLIFLVLPAMAGAQYYSAYPPYGSYYPYDNSAQIAQIQAQINSLYAQLAAMGYPHNGSVLGAYTGLSCNFTQDLSIGSYGQEVADLNRLLGAGLGYSFDQNTFNAVARFQSNYASEVLSPAGLSYPTGFVGSFTRAKLNQICNNTPGSYSGAVLGASAYLPAQAGNAYYYSGSPNYSPYNPTYNSAYNYAGYNNCQYNSPGYCYPYQYQYAVPSVSLSASSQSVSRGSGVTLNWSSNNSTSCSASGGNWSGTKGPFGAEYVSHIDDPTTFILTCTSTYSGLAGSASVTVNVY